MKWEIVIGLEVHAQLSTSSKIFSGASTAFGAEANTQACAVDLALPGVLPVLNRGAVERAIKFGLAVGAHIAPRSVFSRKNYFYPDLPKGYQISQFDLPIIGQGGLTICVPETTTEKAYEKLVRLTRAHLEEDAGKSLHEDFRGMTGIDLNRAGTPLLEIVSEPDMRSATEAVIYAKMLHTLVRWIGICDGNMQEGSLRFDANVSVRRPGSELGARREIKNLNSFRFLQQAIEYEAQWQIDTLEAGGKVQQATVLFDSDKCETRAMRSKEDAHDYRYFPDPDLLPVAIDADWIERVRKTLPELPLAKRARYVADLDLSAYDADTLTSSREMADLFEATLSEVPREAKLCANWLMGDVSASLNREDLDVAHCPISPQQLGGVLKRIADGTISNFAAKEVFKTLWSEGGDPDVIIEEKGLKQISDVGTLEAMIDKIIADNTAQVAEYRSGKEKVFGFFVGLAMKASKGSANPAQMQEILKRKLSNQK
ncbi:MAG: Asp-tRNA(Asn)/Glu-tRNA(Gln) amidotransferase subunit GatB [Candidatus Nitrotoga sp.]|nr:Asp-tRNA(Asn)/Glu-tRNA(Gln) amidotransferase subunit GatB [Candidatus Nitrotoga sp.]MBP0117174.1 Asp-tRNA(Asn)/Glu-tRNA(Gln) amidotransferase subunit GatB [Candidatus Nitrotoga sp.]MBP0122723.1 Asp-tRNA(Asn)/Glu-tRNA(Gln) amidotransferase subunit GatB [Candidatus Nitrotoga sp.]MBP0125884.1 Asp-tRNA(Asn)/Glu-tRNA(Gln) amidotransferase subunit GatB [Candidatus Nitrotoga sp.]